MERVYVYQSAVAEINSSASNQDSEQGEDDDDHNTLEFSNGKSSERIGKYSSLTPVPGNQ